MTKTMTNEKKPCIKGNLHFLPCAQYYVFSHGITIAVHNPETLFYAMDLVLTNEEVLLETITRTEDSSVRHILRGNVKGRQCISFELSEDEVHQFSDLIGIEIAQREIAPCECVMRMFRAKNVPREDYEL